MREAARQAALPTLYDHNSDYVIPYQDTKFLSWKSSRATSHDALYYKKFYARARQENICSTDKINMYIYTHTYI